MAFGFGLALLGGCAGSGGMARAAAKADPEAMLTGERFTVEEKAVAIDAIWDQGPTREAARERLKQIAWGGRWPREVRVLAVRKLADDAGDAASADTRAMLLRLIATEPNQYFRWDLCKLVAERGWSDLSPALAISMSQFVNGIEPRDRAEYRALTQLFPGRSVERSLLEVFLAPVPAEVTVVSERQRLERAREAAWSSLAQLDPAGTSRATMLTEVGGALGGGPNADPLVAAMVASVRELGALPITASEVRWAVALRDFAAADLPGRPGGAARRARWEAVAAAASALDADRRAGLRLRHTGALALAGPELLSASADQLRQRLAARVGGRGGSADARAYANLVWGELVTIAVLDGLISRPEVVEELIKQSELDNADRTTEHGGLIFASGSPPVVEARRYLPRPMDRVNDREYVAPPELFEAETLALAHYHFHATRLSNREYAGPGLTDRRIADVHGRANLVLTPVGKGKFNAVYYAAGGIVVDLGDLSR